jgi:predicted Zn-dependent protease
LKVKPWQIIFFVFIVVGVTILLFPDKEELVPIYIETGQLEKAQVCLTELLAKDPNNARFLALASRLFLLRGEPHKAIAALERAIRQDPRDVPDLMELAQLYEWNRDPKAAMRVWEKIAEVDPDNAGAWNKLINYDRYYGHSEKEASAISHLVLLEEKLPPEQVSADPLMRLITTELESLSKLSMKEKEDDPYLDALMSSLYLIRKQYREEIMEPDQEGHPPDRTGAILKCIEAFVRTDQAKRGTAFVSYLDREKGSGIRNRLEMVEVLRWNGMDKQALMLLTEINRTNPENQEILLSMAKIAEEVNNLDTAIQAYEQLVENDPDKMDYRRHLAALYLESNDPAKAFPLYVQLAESTGGTSEYVDELIKVAGYTGNAVLQARAIEIALKLRPDDPFVLRKMADLYLAREQPASAYPIYLKLADLSGGNRADILKMLEVAGYTGDKSAVEGAVKTALRLLPSDPEIEKTAARMYLSIDRPEKAYELYRRLAIRHKGGRENIDRMLQAANFTGQAKLIGEALVLSRKLRPEDAALQLKLAKFYLSQGREKKAITAYRNYLNLKPGDLPARRQLSKLYLWTNQPKQAFEQILKVAEKGGRKKGELLEAAKMAEQAGLLDQAYRIYRDLFRQYPENAALQDNLIRLASWTDRSADVTNILGDISEKDPGSFKKALTAGEAYVDAGKIKQGVPFLERALKLRPEDISLRRRLATYYGWLGPADKLIAQLEYLDGKGLLKEEDHITLAQTYLDRKDGVRALKQLEYLERAEKLSQKGGIMLANAYELAGKDEAAIRIYRRLSQENSENPKLLARLGNQALWLKQPGLALHFYDMALRKNPNSLIALKGSAQVYAWNNDPERAIRRFRAYNRLNPDDYEVRYQLGELYFANGRRGEAFKQYKKALHLIKETEVTQNPGVSARDRN